MACAAGKAFQQLRLIAIANQPLPAAYPRFTAIATR